MGALLAALLALLVWHAAPLRQACLNACHRLPDLRTFGPAAIADAGRFGLRTGLLCCAICGPAMVLCMLLPAGHVAAMAAVTMLAFLERQMPPKRRAWRVPLPSFAAEPGWRWLTLPDRTA